MDLNGGKNNELMRISRRSALVRTLSACAAGSAAAILPHGLSFAEELPVGNANVPQPNANIVNAQVAPAGAQPANPQGEFVSHSIYLHGDWRDVKVISGVAFGNGHGGTDIWSSDPNLLLKKYYQLEFTGILPIPEWLHHYYLTVKLEVSDSRSDKVGVVFRYVRRRAMDGVFPATFTFPINTGLTSDGP